MAQINNLPAMQETRVQFLGWEDLLEKGMATHSNILAWRIPWTEEPGGLHTVHGVAESRTGLRDSHTHTYTFVGVTSQPSTLLWLGPLWSLVLGSRPVLQPRLRPVVYGFAQVHSLSVSPWTIWGPLGPPAWPRSPPLLFHVGHLAFGSCLPPLQPRIDHQSPRPFIKRMRILGA